MARLLSTALLTLSLSAHAADIHVAPNGSDSGSGTERRPLKTLTAARNAMREASGKGRIVIKGGIYRLDSTFELGPRDSNTTYMAAPGEVVRIVGGRRIAASAVKPVADKAILDRIVESSARRMVRRIDLKALGITSFGELGPRGFRRAYIPAPLELFIDGKAQNVARWPNAGEKHIKVGRVVAKGSSPRGGDYSFKVGAFEYDVERPERWTRAEDVYVTGRFGQQWADDTIKIAKIDTAAGTFTTTHPHLYGFKQAWYTSWYALNLLEEIDQPGEYYVDKKAGILCLYPPEGFSAKSEVFVSLLDKPMVAIENAESIRFENITFEITRDSGIYVEGGKNNTIAGCTLRNIGGIAVQLGQGIKSFPYGKHNGCGKKADGKPGEPVSRMMGSWHEHIYEYTAWDRNAGTGHGIVGCDIHDVGAGGIMLGGGDRKTLTPGKNMVKNCDIYRVNRWDRTYKAPVNVDGVGNIIVNNHLHHATGSAVYLHGNDHVVEFNEIDHVVTDCSDMGAIYMGRDPSETGNSFSYNFFHDIHGGGGHGVQAIFFDDCSFGGAKVIGNVFYKAGGNATIKFYGGGNCEIRNNIFINCPNMLKGASDNTKRCYNYMMGKSRGGLGKRRVREMVDITKPPYSTRYPDLLAVYQGKMSVTTKPEQNYVVKDDMSQFVDGAGMNFKLKADSKVFREIKGFKPIPFEKIGICRDKGLPDLTAQRPVQARKAAEALTEGGSGASESVRDAVRPQAE